MNKFQEEEINLPPIIRELNNILPHPSDLHVLFVAYKELKLIVVYVKNKNESEFQKFKEYPILKVPGKLGPKLQQGDHQVPEGFYFINRFNPKSKFHLSLGINYPNELDVSQQHTGSDIFIHGGNHSVGCIPVGDEAIEEIYTMANLSRENGQTAIPVYIFPFPLTQNSLKKRKFEIDSAVVKFWGNLQTGYLKFVKEKKQLSYIIKNSEYRFT